MEESSDPAKYKPEDTFSFGFQRKTGPVPYATSRPDISRMNISREEGLSKTQHELNGFGRAEIDTSFGIAR
ncbi:hypothetical protein J7L01_06585, partial [bacterium]|nr:hypothetical protein [bacterium]